MRLPLLPAALAAALAAVTVSPPAAVAGAGEPVARLDIVDRAIEHHGGELYRASDTRLRLCSGSGCYRIAARVDGGLFDYRVSGPYRGTERTVHWSNDSLTLWRDGEPMAVLDGAEQPLRDWAMARVYFPFLPYRLNDPGVWKHDLGEETWEGRTLRKVKVTFESGSSTDADDQYLYWFDPETARLVQFAYSFAGSPGGLRFRRLENYRRVGGLLFADQLNLGAAGDELVVDQISPGFVRDRMRPVSEVRLDEIVVEPLAGD